MNKNSLFLIAAVFLVTVFAASTIAFAVSSFKPGNYTQTGEVNSDNSGGYCYWASDTDNSGSGGGFCNSGQGKSEWPEALGMTEEDYYQARQSGKTIEELAVEKGISVEDAVNKVFSDDIEYLEELVSNGEIDREKAEEIIEFRKDRLIDRTDDNPGPPVWSDGGNGMGCGNRNVSY